MTDSYQHEFVYDPSRILAENYCIMASSALIWFDSALTFTTEVDLIWRRKRNLATISYVLMRYSSVVARMVFTFEILLWNVNRETCGLISHLNDALYILNLLATAAVLIVRIYGITAKKWKYLLVVLPLCLVRPVLYMIETAKYIPIQAGKPLGCSYIYALSQKTLEQFSYIASSTTIASHCILLVFTAIKTFSIKRHTWRTRMRTPMATLLVRDAIVFLIVVVFNAFAKFYASPRDSTSIFLVWPYFYEVLNVIIISRFMLDIRGLGMNVDEPHHPYLPLEAIKVNHLPTKPPLALYMGRSTKGYMFRADVRQNKVLLL